MKMARKMSNWRDNELLSLTTVAEIVRQIQGSAETLLIMTKL